MRNRLKEAVFFIGVACAVLPTGPAQALDCENKITSAGFEERFSDLSCIRSADRVAFTAEGASPSGVELGAPPPDASSAFLLLAEDDPATAGRRAVNSASPLHYGEAAAGLTSAPEGVAGKCYLFDGSGGITFPNIFTTISEVKQKGISYSAWIKPRSLSGQRLILGSSLGGYSNPGFYMKNGKLGVFFASSGPYHPVEGSTTVGADEWHHVGASYEPVSGQVHLFLDGAVEASYMSPPLADSESPVKYVAGSLAWGAGSAFDGHIDEISVRMRPMFPAEAAELYQRRNTAGGFESEMIFTGGAFNNLSLSLTESNRGASAVYIDTGNGWREMPYNSSLLFQSSAYPPFGSFRYKIVFRAPTTVQSVRFSWSAEQYPSKDTPISFRTVSDTYSGHEGHLRETVKDAFARNPTMNLMVATGDFENLSLIDGQTQALLAPLFPYPRAVPWITTTSNHILESATRVEYTTELLNSKIEERLPGIAAFRSGPMHPGRPHSAFSFDYGNAHFVVLDQYLESETGVMNPRACVWEETLTWLEEDFHQTGKPFIFVFGHEGAFPIPDPPYNNHYGDSLDDHDCPGNYDPARRTERPMRDRFWALLRKYNVTAHFVGHSHAASAQIIKDAGGIVRVNGGENLGAEDGTLEVDDGYAALWGTYHIVSVFPRYVLFERYKGNGQVGGFSLDAAWNYSTAGGGPSCFDGLQNGGEAGPDCGGSCPNSCSSASSSDSSSSAGSQGSSSSSPPVECKEVRTTGVRKKIERAVIRLVRRQASLSGYAAPLQQVKSFSRRMARWPAGARLCPERSMCERGAAAQVFRRARAQAVRLRKAALRAARSGAGLARQWQKALDLFAPVSGFLCGELVVR